MKLRFKALAVLVLLLALAAVSNLSPASAFAGGTGDNRYIAGDFTLTSIDLYGPATDQIKSFYRSKSGRTLVLRLRERPTQISATYAKLQLSSTGDDIRVVTKKPGHVLYGWIAPKGWYVSNLYIRFKDAPVDTSASGLGSMCGSMGCG